MVLHPNAGAVLVVGLGCENNQPDVFREFLGEYDKDRVKFMVTQKVGDEYEEGMEILRELYAKVSKDERTDVPLSELRVGLKCGGSDGFRKALHRTHNSYHISVYILRLFLPM